MERKMSIEELHGKYVRIKRLWTIHSIFPTSWMSFKIHQIYNEMSEYGHWKGTKEFILSSESA